MGGMQPPGMMWDPAQQQMMAAQFGGMNPMGMDMASMYMPGQFQPGMMMSGPMDPSFQQQPQAVSQSLPSSNMPNRIIIQQQ